MWPTWSTSSTTNPDFTRIEYDSWNGWLQRYNDTETWRTSWTWSPNTNTRYHIVITWDWTWYTAYLNWNIMTKTKSWTVWTSWKEILIWNNLSNSQVNWLLWSLSNIIIEKVIWWPQKITSYLKKMKSLYWIS